MGELTLEILRRAVDEIPHPGRYDIKFVETDDEYKLMMCEGPDGIFFIDEVNKLQIAYVQIGTMSALYKMATGEFPVQKIVEFDGIPVVYSDYILDTERD